MEEVGREEEERGVGREEGGWRGFRRRSVGGWEGRNEEEERVVSKMDEMEAVVEKRCAGRE